MGWLDDFLSVPVKLAGTLVSRLGGPTGRDLNLSSAFSCAVNPATGAVDVDVPALARPGVIASGYYTAGAPPGGYPATLALTDSRGATVAITENPEGVFAVQLTDTTTACVVIPVALGTAGHAAATIPAAGAFTITRTSDADVQVHAGFSFIAVEV